MTATRGARAVKWIEHFCICPDGPNRGRPARLTAGEVSKLLSLYDHDGPGDLGALTGPLAAYIVLMHIAGPEAKRGAPVPAVTTVDPWTIWRCAGSMLREVLVRQGAHIACPALGTRWPAAA